MREMIRGTIRERINLNCTEEDKKELFKELMADVNVAVQKQKIDVRGLNLILKKQIKHEVNLLRDAIEDIESLDMLFDWIDLKTREGKLMVVTDWIYNKIDTRLKE